MSEVVEIARELLAREPRSAIPLDELLALLEERGRSVLLREEYLPRVVSELQTELPVLLAPRHRWARELGPRGWILAPAGFGSAPPGTLEARLQSTLRAIAANSELESTRGWVRWLRTVEEANETQAFLRRTRSTQSAEAPQERDGPTQSPSGPPKRALHHPPSRSAFRRRNPAASAASAR